MLKCTKCLQEKDESCFSKLTSDKRGYCYKCKECARLEYSKWLDANREYNKERVREWRDKNTVHRQEYYKKFMTEERRKARVVWAVAYAKKRRKEDKAYMLHHILGCRLRKCIKNKSDILTKETCGCTFQKLVEHLESKFLPGMSWGNYGFGKGKWVIDHIKPIAAFDKTNRDEVKLINHYTNLQPLWFEDNASKGAKWEEPTQASPLDLPPAEVTNLE
jgi:hypothetical protein